MLDENTKAASNIKASFCNLRKCNFQTFIKFSTFASCRRRHFLFSCEKRKQKHTRGKTFRWFSLSTPFLPTKGTPFGIPCAWCNDKMDCYFGVLNLISLACARQLPQRGSLFCLPTMKQALWQENTKKAPKTLDCVLGAAKFLAEKNAG